MFPIVNKHLDIITRGVINKMFPIVNKPYRYMTL